MYFFQSINRCYIMVISDIFITYFVFHEETWKKSKHMANFTRSTTYELILLVISTGFLSIFIREDKKESLWLPISKTFGVWLIASMIFFAVIKYFKLEDKFI